MIKDGRGHSALRLFSRLIRDSRGVSALEYGLYASLIALAAIQAFTGLGIELSNSLDDSTQKLADHTAATATLGNKAISGPNAMAPVPDEPAPAGAPPIPDPSALDANMIAPDEPPIPAAAMPM